MRWLDDWRRGWLIGLLAVIGAVALAVVAVRWW